MSLHYPVKLEMLIEGVLSLSCNRKKLQNLSHFNCGLQIRQIWIQLIATCRKYRKSRCTKQRSLIRSCYWRRHWRMAAEITIHDPVGPIRSQSVFQFVRISCAHFVHLLLQQSTHAVIKRIQIWRPRLRWN